MADTAVASGLMPHQKDEHDIWICKDCGWKYPNAKPSAKIRKNHKKHCTGKALADLHAAGGSSDDASDDEHHSGHHHSPLKETAAAVEVNHEPLVESKPRSFDFGAVAKEKEEDLVAVNGSVNGAAHGDAHGEAPAASVTDRPEATMVSLKEAPEGAVIASGLMPHQKDEHDIWICKDCGWRYPNAKPSPKIRKNHKKHCEGKGKAETAAMAGGSSDEASDDEHHHPTLAAPTARLEGAKDESVTEAPTVISREIDFEALKKSVGPEVKDEIALSAPEAASMKQPPAVVFEKEKPEDATSKGFPKVEVTSGGLMPHQKDEHDIWVCKDCGWKYPNAKPSPKIRKNHKKHCVGKGITPGGGSSDDASDDEHHTSPLVPGAVVPGESENVSVDEHLGVASREFNSQSLQESVDSEVLDKDISTEAMAPILGSGVKEESTVVDVATPMTAPDNINGTREFSLPWVSGSGITGEHSETQIGHSEADSLPVFASIPNDSRDSIGTVEEAEEKNVEPIKLAESTEPAEPAAMVGGLLPHQKDEDDIWICKDCGWKYPNSKPSPKIRKSHKKKCPGKNSGMSTAEGGSSDEASDDEHHVALSTAVPTGQTVPESAAVGSAGVDTVADTIISREMDFKALGLSSSTGDTSPPAAPKETETIAVETTPSPPELPLKEELSSLSASFQETVQMEQEQEKPVESLSLQEALEKESQLEEGRPSKPLSLQEAMDRETEQEKKLMATKLATEESPDAAIAGGGLMLHQKDEDDIWICKECGWKYPNAKPSPKIRKNHKKKCPGRTSLTGVDGATSDEASGDELSIVEGATVKGVEEASGSSLAVPEGSSEGGVGLTSREFSFNTSLHALNASETGVVPAATATDSAVSEPGEEDPMKLARSEEASIPTAEGGLMLHQKNEEDIWICKECGWRYPNAKPSSKIRKNHKKKCPGKVGRAKKGASSDSDSGDGEKPAKVGKCFPCL